MPAKLYANYYLFVKPMMNTGLDIIMILISISPCLNYDSIKRQSHVYFFIVCV